MTASPPAAIALFTYNRPRHTRQTVEFLLKNEPASESELFIFSDGSKGPADEKNVQAVRSYIRTISGFKKITIIERENNRGLADNIIDGVTRVVNDHGRVIVLEDDVVTGPDFLRYMNEALAFYKNEDRVWHISGWNYPIASEGLPDVFLWRVMNCWGWATWVDRWRHFERDPDGLLKNFTKDQKKQFNLDGAYDFWAQVRANAEGRITTWAVFWYAVIFMNNGLCLNPTRSLVKNIGHDGSGIHCGHWQGNDPEDVPGRQTVFVFPDRIRENTEVVDRIKRMLVAKKGGSPIVRRICRSITGKFG